MLIESLLTRDNLVRAMITGRKTVTSGAEAAHGAALAPAWLAALALGAASGIVWMIVAWS